MPSSQPLTVVFDVSHPGERAAGLTPYTETVSVTVASGDVGELAEFKAHMTQALKEWFDGASVWVVETVTVSPGMNSDGALLGLDGKPLVADPAERLKECVRRLDEERGFAAEANAPWSAQAQVTVNVMKQLLGLA